MHIHEAVRAGSAWLPRAVRGLLACAVLVVIGCGQSQNDGAGHAALSTPEHPKEIVHTILSAPFTVDRIFRSMMGPYTTSNVRLAGGPSEDRELLWLTGLMMDVVGPDGQTEESIEYECHTNLLWTAKVPEGVRRPNGQVFTLTQGQVDVRLPPGFGVPAYSTEDLVLNSQVLNLNKPDDNRRVRHRIRMRYVRDRDLTAPMKPLVITGAYVMASLENEDVLYNTDAVDEKAAAASCHAGSLPPGIPAKVPFIVQDKLGHRFTGHWVVKPGRHEYRTLVTDLMQLPYDTTVHYIGVHVHPYSESVELRDVTTSETVWKGIQRSSHDRIGLDSIDHFSSVEGVPVYHDHQYELVSVYNNPTTQDSDAMASIFIYYLDKEFRPPARSSGAVS